MFHYLGRVSSTEIPHAVVHLVIYLLHTLDLYIILSVFPYLKVLTFALSSLGKTLVYPIPTPRQ